MQLTALTNPSRDRRFGLMGVARFLTCGSLYGGGGGLEFRHDVYRFETGRLVIGWALDLVVDGGDQ